MRVLIIDDRMEPTNAAVGLLRLDGIDVTVARTATEGISLAPTGAFDLILLDLDLPDMFGLTVLRRLRAMGVATPVIVATGVFLEPELEGEARRLGALDFLRWAYLDVEVLAKRLRAAVEQRSCLPRFAMPAPVHGVLAASQVMRDVLAWVEDIGPKTLPVLLTGPTGSGKEVIARAIHAASGRRGRFVGVNCAAVPETLFESELFGHARGAFTGAVDAKRGLAEEADGGTLFLDEIGELPMTQQSRLLRFLDTHEVRRLGETQQRPVNARVIAATNRSIGDALARNRFREDLYYRLAGALRYIPPLCDRPDDIAALTYYWFAQHSQTSGSIALTIEPEALKVLQAHRWPGNVRELRMVLERTLAALTGTVVTERHIGAALTGTPAFTDRGASRQARAEAALRAAGGRPRQAARLLGKHPATLYRWLRGKDDGRS